MTSEGSTNVTLSTDGEQDPTVESMLPPEAAVGHYIDLWKQEVAVQMHFNEIEWKIRGLALTIATFALGAAGVAAKDNIRIGCISLGAMILFLGLFLWYAFYFVDRAWYHPLLKAAVAHGTELEKEIRKTLPRAGMTTAITEASGYKPNWMIQKAIGKPEMRSTDKLEWFYLIGAIALSAAAIILQFGAPHI